MTDLLHRLREGAGADRKLDEAIFDWAGLGIAKWEAIEPYTDELRGLGHCIALVEKLLPGWYFELFLEYGGSWFAKLEAIVGGEKYSVEYRSEACDDPCRATLIALITAKETEHGQ